MTAALTFLFRFSCCKAQNQGQSLAFFFKEAFLSALDDGRIAWSSGHLSLPWKLAFDLLSFNGRRSKKAGLWKKSPTFCKMVSPSQRIETGLYPLGQEKKQSFSGFFAFLGSSSSSSWECLITARFWDVFFFHQKIPGSANVPQWSLELRRKFRMKSGRRRRFFTSVENFRANLQAGDSRAKHRLIASTSSRRPPQSGVTNLPEHQKDLLFSEFSHRNV